MENRYASARQFVEDCVSGMDIEFSFDETGYGVLGWYEGGPLAYRKDAYGYMEQQFQDADALLDGFVIKGHKLRDIITQVELG